MLYGLFATSVMGMYSQSISMNNIGTNVANVNTGGYKRIDTQFASLVSGLVNQEGDLGGMRPKEINRISNQGAMIASDRDLDVAINGTGFFVLNSRIDGSGTTYYGRDGSFRQGNGDEVSVTELDGTTLTIMEGYLADKNGYFVQGWAADENGAFPSPSASGLQSLRMDGWAFYDGPQPTTEASVHLNLPADATVGDSFRYSAGVFDTGGNTQTVTFNFTKTAENTWAVQGNYTTPPTAQVDLVTLRGSVEPGDVYTVTVDGNAVSYTVTGAEADLNAVRTALVAAINADPVVGALVTAADGTGTGELTLTAPAVGTAFTTSVSETEGPATADNTAILVNTVAAAPGVAQVDTVTLGGTVEYGDTYSVTVAGTTVSYVTTGAEADMDAVRDALVAAINADPTVSGLVTAAAGGAGALTLTANTPGGALTNTAAATNVSRITDNGISVAPLATAVVPKVDTVTLGGTVEAGDVYSVTVDGTTVSYTTTGAEADMNAVRDALVAAINADSTVSGLVTAAAGGAGELTLTATSVGASFATTVNASNGGATTDNTASVLTTASTDATSNVTTTSTIFTFDGNAQLPDGTTVTYTIDWPNGETSSTVFDFSNSTQYASEDLVPLTYSRNGNAGGRLTGISFDQNGVVWGSFDNGTSRELYKLALATFVNPDLLTPENGNVFQVNDQTGDPVFIQADINGFAIFLPNALELSNVDLADEFSRMIMTQNAYNSSATAFKTIDEMTETAKDLIR